MFREVIYNTLSPELEESCSVASDAAEHRMADAESITSSLVIEQV